jgi:ribonucleoside-diphosphate reductase alpha chain
MAAKSVFATPAAEFIYISRYSRWLKDQKRREIWSETVDRYMQFIEEQVGSKVPQKVFKKIKHYLSTFRVMPSMRALWSAGDAAKATNVAIYNCAFATIDSVEAFAECLYILMCGTGHGFSVEKKYVDNLPEVPKLTGQGAGTFQIPDSKEGWADSIKHLLQALYSGHDLELDYSLLRGRGARLQTFGGQSSGPAPLINLHEFIRKVFEKAQGRKLKPIECLDILNKIAEIVVVGGVRRSSQIALSDLDDKDIAKAKNWPFPMHRTMSNNSVAYHHKPEAIEFLEEWAKLAKSGTGERGIFNLAGARKRSPDRRDSSKLIGANPCGEIVLRSNQFCNLSEVVIKSEDDLDDVLDKIETAVWIGIIQSTFTYFPYLSRRWKNNCEQERLLGVSLTGQMDNPELFTVDAIKAMKKKALKIARKASKILGINMPAAITCVKPSGTVSQLVHSSSGLHSRFAKYYIRRYRMASIDPLFKLLKEHGVPLQPDNGQSAEDWKKAQEGDLQACSIYEKGKRWTEDKVNTWIISFPICSPSTAVTKNDCSAIEQLEYYKKIQQHWCEHNASMTCYIQDSEWFEVGNWVYQNWDYITGISFLPADGGKYEQAPYEEITKEEYEDLIKESPNIDYSLLSQYEAEDNTTGAKEVACGGSKCDIT